MYLIDVDVQSSTGLPILVAGESAQNIVEIPTVPEHVICSGDGACGIQSGATGEYVHRPGNLLCQIRSTDCESIAELCKEDSGAMLRPLCYNVETALLTALHSNSHCVSARFPARCTACPVVSICLPSQCTPVVLS